MAIARIINSFSVLLLLICFEPMAWATTISGTIDSSLLPQNRDLRLGIYLTGKNTVVKKVFVKQNICRWSYSANGLNPGKYRLQIESADGNKIYHRTVVQITQKAKSFDFSPTRVLRVGKTRKLKKPSEAARIARPGDVIEIDAGKYKADAAIWRAADIVIRGVGGRAHILAQGAHAEGKAAWVIKGDNTRVENIEISGARVPDHNGAAIRQEGRNLTMCNVYMHDNENGLLGGGGTVLVEYSEFARNGYGKGLTHNIYIVNTEKFILRYSYSHHAKIGHNVKSRAKNNFILYNRIMDERAGQSSYGIDIPEGGHAYIIGNIVQQGPYTDNYKIISYGSEVGNTRGGSLTIIHNTLVNHRPGGTFLFIRNGIKANVLNNLFVGSGNPVIGDALMQHNLHIAETGFLDARNFDYRLAESSKARDVAKDLKNGMFAKWAPAYSYQHKSNRNKRVTKQSRPDIGAYEYKNDEKYTNKQ